MADKHSGGGPIPDGWELRTESDQKLSYYCPATAQHFFTYEDLMRYVKYAKEAKLSIYAPDFESNKRRGKRRRRKTNSELLNSRPLPVNQSMESSEPAADTKTAETTDTGKKTIKDGQEPIVESAETTDAGKANEADQEEYALGGCYKA